MDAGFTEKDQVRQAIDIVELVQSYVTVRREGRHYKALCPWHDDSRPSLHINPERQIFRCFVCNIGGDVFSFVMRMEQIEFREALEMLAERAGISLKRQAPAGEIASSGFDKKSLLQAAAWAEKEFYQYLMTAPDAEKANKYLRERGIFSESIRRFHLGYSPEDWDWMLRRARGTPYSPEVLERVGLAIRKSNGPGYYDRFRGRVLFSIRDTQGRPVGIGGRVLPGAKDDTAKYINSPESPLFSKSSLLYGLDSARDAISKSGEAVVMEGYTDVILARQAGFDNTVAVLGTALGERHVQLLKRFAERVVLVLDGDDAGRKRANEVLPLFLAGQLDLRILTLPDDLDPCDFIARQGAGAFRELLSEAVDALEHKIRSVTRSIDPAAGTHQANSALEEILATMAQAPRVPATMSSAVALRESQLLERLAREFRVTSENLRRRLGDIRSDRARPARTPASSTGARESAAPIRLPAWDSELLALLLAWPDLIELAEREIDPRWLESELARTIFVKMSALWVEGIEPTLDRLLLEFPDPAWQTLLVDHSERGQRITLEQPAQTLQDLAASFQRRENDRTRRAETAKLGKGLNEEEELELLRRIHEREKARQGLTTPMDG
jgi:DNA primase